MSNANAAQNNNHPLVGIARDLTNWFKMLTEYQTEDRCECSVEHHLQILNNTLLGTIRSNLVERLKLEFEAILDAVVDGFPFAGNLHRHASDFKLLAKKTFGSIVDFTIDVETRLLKDKKQDLLGDIHTQLTNAMTSEMLMKRLRPTYRFKSRFMLHEMIRRHHPSFVAQLPDEYPMNDRIRLDERQMTTLSRILQRMVTRFNAISVPVILEMLYNKRKRNDGKHYDSRIQAHIRTHQGRERQFRTFIQDQRLLRAFDNNEIDQTQGMYAAHCRFSAIDWHERFRPSEHIWVYNSNGHRDLAVYVRPENDNDDKHRVKHYQDYNGGQQVHPKTRLEKLGV